MPETYFFKDVTLLITHYNRSSSLERLLSSFRTLHAKFDDIVVSDDGSKSEHLDKLQSLRHEYGFQLITAHQNRGLGNNINKGQDAVKTLYTLYVQEDFVPNPGFMPHFSDALEIIRNSDDIDIIRFYAYVRYPCLEPFKKGFSEMKFKAWIPGHFKFLQYSDHPHLRRSNFLEKFGRYAEGLKGDDTEYRMVISFIQKKGKALFYDDFKGLFEQKNSAVEPSTMKRNFWRESDNFFIAVLREMYRFLKFNYDYLFMRT